MNKRQLLCGLLLFFLAIVVQQESMAQTRKITGTIKDENDAPLTGVTVEATKTPGNASIGTATDAQGKFSLTIDPSYKRLNITSVGYTSQNIEIGGKLVFTITLQKNDAENLSDVIVVAYGQQKKASVTAAISSISAKEIVQSPVASISNSLAGRLPGLISMQTSGKPGADASTLLIRGLGTYGVNTAPLIMVDGVIRETYNEIDPNEIENISILKDASATAVFGVRGANGVIMINTKRGKEGTPKINATVQSAANQFTRLPEYVNSYQYATLRNEQIWETYWKDHANDADVLNQTDGWAKFAAKRQAGYTPQYTDEDLTYFQNAHTPTLADGSPNPYYDPYFHPDQDWQAQIYKNYGPQTQANVNVTGGNRGMKYFLSAGYLTQGGLFNTDYMPFSKDMDYRKNRYNVRGNFDFDINENFKISLNLGTQFLKITGMDNDGYNYEKNLMWTNPMGSPGVIDGKFTFIWGKTAEQFNPLYSLAMRNKYNINNNSTLNSSLNLTHKLDFITKGLTVNLKGAYDSYFSSQSEGQSYPVYWTVRPNPNGNNQDPIWVQMNNEAPSVRRTNYFKGKWRSWYAEFAFNYNRTFGDHAITALAMANLSKKFDPDYQYDLPHAYQTLVSRVTYAYQGKYLAEFDMGYNGSENFIEGKRFDYFPAYSMGWIASKENFWPENDYVTFLKVRGSYGKVGNDIPKDLKGDRYIYLPDVWAYSGSIMQGYYFGQNGSNRNNVRAAYESVLGNPNVTWETAQKLNIGFEVNLWSNKINIVFDHFTERREGILTKRGTVPGIVAAQLPASNLGIVKNWGNELEVTYRDKVGKNFDYWIKGNVANTLNKIVYRDEAIPDGLEYQAATGKPIGQGSYLQANGLYTSWADLYEMDGNGNPDLSRPVTAIGPDGKPYTNAAGQPVYQRDLSPNSVPLQPGEIKFTDVNYDGAIDNKDYKRSGYTNVPRVTYGISFGFNYKGFDMSALLQGAAGVAADPMPNTNLHFNGTTEALFEVDWNRFTPERYAAGEKINFPIAAYNRQAYLNTYFHLNTSYVRLKNLEVGYTFQRGILDNVGIGSVRVYANGFNLYTWSQNKIWGDPENMGFMGYPLTRTYNAGIKVGF
jgi:TonB-linked SusC/RagA family outer membrane protein